MAPDSRHEETSRTQDVRAPPASPPMTASAVRDAVRGYGVMVGPTLLLDLAVAASTFAVITKRLPRRDRPLGRVLRPLTILGAAFPWVYLGVLHPWMARWGATDEEVRMPLPGDELVPRAPWVSTRAITIEAPVDEVWPWLAQVGQDRGGFYSYTWLENLAGAQIRNADRVHPEWQHRDIGERVHLHPATGLDVVAFEPQRAIVLEGGWTFALRPLDEHRTRLLLRSRSKGWAVLFSALLLDIPHFIMEVGMMRGLKQRAERAARGSTPTH